MVTKVISWLLLLDACWLIGGGNGLFTANTQDTLVLAILLPILCRTYSPAWFVFVLSIWWVHGVSSLVVLFLGLLLNPQFKLKKTLIGAAVVLFSTLSFEHKVPLRVELWRGYLQWWSANAPVLVGTGPGSYEWVSLLHLDRRMWPHNDWLQLLFESGYIGAALALGFFTLTAWRVRHDSAWLSFALLLGLGMCVYSPLQFFIVQWFVYLLLRRAYGHT